MFQKLIKEFDEVIEEDDFMQIIILLISTSRFKLFFFYLYTFTLKKGGGYRECVGFIKFPYYLRYKLFVKYLKWSILGKDK